MKNDMYWSQQASERPAPRRRGLHERGTHEGWHRRTSYYVKMKKHPGLTARAALGAGLAVRALLLPRGADGTAG